jgi:hypothetical protein
MQSGPLDTNDSVTCQWEDCGKVFTHLPTLIHHIHNGKFRLVLGCMPLVEKCGAVKILAHASWWRKRLIYWFITCLLTRDVFLCYRSYWRAQVKLYMWMDVLWTTRTGPNLSFCIDISYPIAYGWKTFRLRVTRWILFLNYLWPYWLTQDPLRMRQVFHSLRCTRQAHETTT